MKPIKLSLLLVGLLTTASLAAQPGLTPLQGFAQGPAFAPGFAPGLGLIILAERRFDPFVQRLIAERSLQALPLYGGQLFYLVPTGSNAGEAGMQIRYLERLLRERSEREAETSGVMDDE